MKSWDEMREGVTDKQTAAERIAYKQGVYWVEECLVRSEEGQIIGKIVNKTFISNARVPRWLDHVKNGVVDD